MVRDRARTQKQQRRDRCTWGGGKGRNSSDWCGKKLRESFELMLANGGKVGKQLCRTSAKLGLKGETPVF